MRNVLDELAAAERVVTRRESGGTELVSALVRRSYEAAVPDVWSALTDPERLARWFTPVSGDLRPGGAFAVQGNAEGEIRGCEPPHRLVVTWGGPVSIVEVRLSERGGGTLLELEHTVPVEFVGSGAGALYVGPGWDVAVLGLVGFLRGDVVDDPAAWENTLEGQQASARSIDAWAEAVRAGGTATEEEIDAGIAAAQAQFTPDLVGEA